MHEEPEKNDYYSLRDEVIKAVLSFSRKITAFAMLEELSDLQGIFCYSQQELSIAKDDKLILVSHLIINKLREFLDDMSEYGVDEDALTSFIELSEHFQSVMDTKTETFHTIDMNHDVMAQ